MKYEVKWQQVESIIIDAESKEDAEKQVLDGDFEDAFVEHGEVTSNPIAKLIQLNQ